MLIYSLYTPCNLLEKHKNSVKFFGQLMDPYVRGIEMKLNKYPGPQAPSMLNSPLHNGPLNGEGPSPVSDCM